MPRLRLPRRPCRRLWRESTRRLTNNESCLYARRLLLFTFPDMRVELCGLWGPQVVRPIQQDKTGRRIKPATAPLAQQRNPLVASVLSEANKTPLCVFLLYWFSLFFFYLGRQTHDRKFCFGWEGNAPPRIACGIFATSPASLVLGPLR